MNVKDDVCIMFFMFVAQRMSWNHKKVKTQDWIIQLIMSWSALGREADFLHSTIDTYITDAQRENKTKLVEVWNNIKQDKQEHLDMLKNCLENEVAEQLK